MRHLPPNSPRLAETRDPLRVVSETMYLDIHGSAEEEIFDFESLGSPLLEVHSRVKWTFFFSVKCDVVDQLL